MEFRNYSVGELEALLDDREFWRCAPLPITPARALSQARNPRARADDVALIAALAQGRVVGYLGALPDQLYLTERPEPFAWLSAWWVAPEARPTGVGAMLLYKILQAHRRRVGVSGYSQASARVFEAGRDFVPLRELAGLRWVLRPAAARLQRRLGRWGKLAPVARPALDALGWAMAGRLRRWLAEREARAPVTLRRIEAIDAEAAALIAAAPTGELTRRGPAELNWVLRYPWTLEGPLPDDLNPRYYFGAVAPQCHLHAYKVLADDGGLAGVICVRSSAGKIKVPYAFFEARRIGAIVTALLRVACEEQACELTVLYPSLVAALEAASVPCLKQHRITRRSVVARTLGAGLRAEQWLHPGDGDEVFY